MTIRAKSSGWIHWRWNLGCTYTHPCIHVTAYTIYGRTLEVGDRWERRVHPEGGLYFCDREKVCKFTTDHGYMPTLNSAYSPTHTCTRNCRATPSTTLLTRLNNTLLKMGLRRRYFQRNEHLCWKYAKLDDVDTTLSITIINACSGSSLTMRSIWLIISRSKWLCLYSVRRAICQALSRA